MSEMSESKQNPLKAIGLALAGALMLLAPAGMYLYLRSSGDVAGKTQEPAGTVSAAPAQGRPSAAGKSKRAYPQFEVVDSKPADPAGAVPAKPPTVVQAAQRPAEPRFPTPADLPGGMDRSALILKFGRPAMSTTEVNEGRTFETFHYLRPETGTETVVLLSAGKVLTSATITY
jgi:hypothetical protein